jgi:xylulokinase
MANICLGIDIGTTSAKGLAVDEGGEIIALAQHSYPLAHPRANWAEQDPEDYWQGVVAVVRECAATCAERGRNADEIRALALSTQGDTLIVAGESGRPLAPAMSWMDRRAAAEHRQLLAETGPSFWYRHSGARLTALSSACKIRWLSRNAPDLYSRVRRFCWVPDFLAHRLCGRFVIDMPSASWTPFGSPFERRWSCEAMQLLRVAPESLPEIVESGTPIGALLPAAAAELGLRAETMVVAGAFDQSAAAHGAGAVAGRTSVLSCGTAWVLYGVAAAPIADEREMVPVCCHTSPTEWGMVLPFPGGGVYDWFNRTCPPDSPAGASDANSASAADGRRANAPPIFVPHLYGGLAPDWREQSRGSFVGLTMAHTANDLRLAVMRGLAHEARRNVETAQRLCGAIASLRLVGGTGKSNVCSQLIADVLARPIAVSLITEAACYGAAELAAGESAADWRALDCLREFTPVPERIEAEEMSYARYLECLEALWRLYARELPA